jgi:methyl-accepting chemotaxis protein
MQWFRNRTVMAKLVLAFMAVATLMVVVTVKDLRSLGTLHEDFQDVYDNRLVPITQAAAMQRAMLMVRVAVLRHVTATEPAQMKELEAEVRRHDGEFAEELKKYEATKLVPEEEQALAELKAKWADYRRARDGETLTLSTAGKKPEALAAAVGGVGRHFDGAATAVDQLLAINTKIAQDMARSADANYDFAFYTTLAMLAGGVLMALLLGGGIARMISRPLATSVDVLEAVAAGDLTRRLDFDTEDEVGRLATALNGAVDGMRNALREVRRAADQAATASQEMSAASQTLSSGAQEQASSLEETAASLEEITGTVKQNADNARQANQLAVGSRDVAEKGGRVVAEAVEAMSEINASSRKIAAIITTIDEIAFQTNLLALNAAVEAARAGEQGRGFAVVAAEVRNLAQRSATAAKEIKGLIEDSVQKVEGGSELVNKSGETLSEIVGSVKRVTDIIAEIAAASSEQTTGIDQVNKAVSQMDQVTQANAAQTEELSSTAQALATQAQQLQTLVARFQLDDGARGQRTSPAPAPVAPRAGVAAVLPVPARTAVPGPKPVEAPALVAHNGNGHGGGHGAARDGFEEF